MNLHTPERGATESQADYRKRQHASKRAVQAMTLSKIHNQRGKPSQRQQLRDAQRTNGHGPRGIYADAIGWNVSKKRADSEAHKAKHELRDENGAFTLVGRDPLRRIGTDGREVRRMWLAGISAQRNY
jgi:hypothetical protein